MHLHDNPSDEKKSCSIFVYLLTFTALIVGFIWIYIAFIHKQVGWVATILCVSYGVGFLFLVIMVFVNKQIYVIDDIEDFTRDGNEGTCKRCCETPTYNCTQVGWFIIVVNSVAFFISSGMVFVEDVKEGDGGGLVWNIVFSLLYLFLIIFAYWVYYKNMVFLINERKKHRLFVPN